MKREKITDIEKIKEVIELLKRKVAGVKDSQFTLGLQGLEPTEILEGREQGYNNILSILNGEELREVWLDYVVGKYLGEDE